MIHISHSDRIRRRSGSSVHTLTDKRDITLRRKKYDVINITYYYCNKKNISRDVIKVVKKYYVILITCDYVVIGHI